MATDLDRIRAYYDGFDEWDRLGSPAGALEFRRACAILNTHLPATARVLDLGGGPGRYTIELARRGHRVALADVSPTLLAKARHKIAEAGVSHNVDSIDEVDARDLARYADGEFDAVIAFGPFYHLLSHDERTAAAREIRRVLAPGGLTFVAFIPRLSGLAGLLERAASNPEQVGPGSVTRAATTGIFRNHSARGFQEGCYLTPSELEQLFAATGFTVLETVSLRSIGNNLETALLRAKQPVRAELERLLDGVARDPAVVATGGHAVLVARTPGS